MGRLSTTGSTEGAGDDSSLLMSLSVSPIPRPPTKQPSETTTPHSALFASPDKQQQLRDYSPNTPPEALVVKMDVQQRQRRDDEARQRHAQQQATRDITENVCFHTSLLELEEDSSNNQMASFSCPTTPSPPLVLQHRPRRPTTKGLELDDFQHPTCVSPPPTKSTEIIYNDFVSQEEQVHQGRQEGQEIVTTTTTPTTPRWTTPYTTTNTVGFPLTPSPSLWEAAGSLIPQVSPTGSESSFVLQFPVAATEEAHYAESSSSSSRSVNDERSEHPKRVRLHPRRVGMHRCDSAPPVLWDLHQEASPTTPGSVHPLHRCDSAPPVLWDAPANEEERHANTSSQHPKQRVRLHPRRVGMHRCDSAPALWDPHQTSPTLPVPTTTAPAMGSSLARSLSTPDLHQGTLLQPRSFVPLLPTMSTPEEEQLQRPLCRLSLLSPSHPMRVLYLTPEL